MAPKRGRGASGGRTRRLRIAALYVPDTPNTWYRSLVPLRALERRGHQVLWPSRGNPLAELLADPPRCDVFVISHYFDERLLAEVQRLRRQGVAVVWDKDDDISASRRGSEIRVRYGGRRGQRRAFACSVEVAAACSLMTTPSAHLAQRYRDEGVERVEVIENFLAPEQLAGDRPRHPGVVIGLTAAGEHRHDIRKLSIEKLLGRLLAAHEGVRVVSIGCPLDLPEGRHVNHRDVPIAQLVAAERTFDVGLAPLVDSPFNRARSNVKLKEYAAAGATWVASPVGPYAGMGEQQGGLLVADGDWYGTLEQLVVDYRRRGELMERARAWAPTQSIEHAVDRWEAALADVVARA